MNPIIANRIINYSKRVLGTKVPVEPIIDAFVPKMPGHPVKVKNGFEDATPESVGVSSRSVKEFLRLLHDDASLNMHTVTIFKDNKIICRAGFGAYRTDYPQYTFSACKSVTSLAIGILVGDGLLSVEEKVTDIFPDEVNAISRLTLRDLTVRGLLTMQSGVMFNEAASMVEKNWTKGFLNSMILGDVGKTFNYNSLNTYMLAAIICKKTGKTLTEFLGERLFAPLGITDIVWDKSPEGIEKGGWGLYIAPEDFIKLGKFVYDGGVWEGKRYIPEEYIKEATRAQITPPENYGDFNYGFQIWVGRKENTFLFNGMFGQNLLCYRNTGLIIMSTSGNNELFQQSRYFLHVKECFSTPERYKATSPDLVGNSELQQYIAFLSQASDPIPAYRRMFLNSKERELRSFISSIDGLKLITESKTPFSVYPLVMQVLNNNFSKGFIGVNFELRRNTLYLIWREADGNTEIPIGFGKFNYFILGSALREFNAASSGVFIINEDKKVLLKVRIDLIEEPSSVVLKFIFDENRVTLHMDELPGCEFLRWTVGDFGKELIGNSKMLSLFTEKIDMEYVYYMLEHRLSPKIILKKASDVALLPDAIENGGVNEK